MATSKVDAVRDKAFEEVNPLISSTRERERVINACISSSEKRWQDLINRIDSISGQFPECYVMPIAPMKTQDEIRIENAERSCKSYWARIASREEERQFV